MQSNSKQNSHNKIPEIAGSLEKLFILRTILSIFFILAGIAVLYFGMEIILANMGAGQNTIFFELGAAFKITAAGFGGVVFASATVAFYLAYRTRPTLKLTPVPRGASSGEPARAAGTQADDGTDSEPGLRSEEGGAAKRWSSTVCRLLYATPVCELVQKLWLPPEESSLRLYQGENCWSVRN